MKKMLLHVAILACVCCCMILGICMGIDPYNIFHYSNLRDNGIEPNKNYIKMSYILDHPTDFDSFVFGSSRVGSIHVEKLEGLHCYNMTYSQGLPAEHLDNLKTLLCAGITPKRVYIGVDNLAYSYDPLVHKSEPVRAPYEYLKSNPAEFAKLYLNTSLAFSSLEISSGYQSADSDFVKNFYAYGAYNYYGGTTLAERDASAYVPSHGPASRMEEALAELQEICTLCEENDIELVLFTNPLYELTYDYAMAHDYREFLTRLAAIHPYYNFSCRSNICTDATHFIDTSHYDAFVGDMMIDCMEHNGASTDPTLINQGFGLYITPETIGELEKTL